MTRTRTHLVHAMLIAAVTSSLGGTWHHGLHAASPVRTPAVVPESATRAGQDARPASNAEGLEGYSEALGIHYPTGPGLATRVLSLIHI